MSLNKEEKFLDQKIDLSELEKSNLIRIKHRKIFYFQYMEYDFTHVLQINPNHNQIEFKNILDFINDHSKLNKYILCLFSDENLIKKSTYEIEIEINNKDPYFAGVLNKPDGRPEATKLIQRFFRNLESLYMHDFHDIFFQNFLNPDYFNQNQQFIPNIRTPNPIVGNYMINEAYDHWKNILKG